MSQKLRSVRFRRTLPRTVAGINRLLDRNNDADLAPLAVAVLCASSLWKHKSGKRWGLFIGDDWNEFTTAELRRTIRTVAEDQGGIDPVAEAFYL